MAARLSEDPSVSVLLLEAGGEEDDYWFSHIPGLATGLQLTDFDWKYLTEPQKHCCGALKNRVSTSLSLNPDEELDPEKKTITRLQILILILSEFRRSTSFIARHVASRQGLRRLQYTQLYELCSMQSERLRSLGQRFE